MYQTESNHFKSKAVNNGNLIKFDEQTKSGLSQKLYEIWWINWKAAIRGSFI